MRDLTILFPVMEVDLLSVWQNKLYDFGNLPDLWLLKQKGLKGYRVILRSFI